jgi:hypothetical protein
MPEDTVLAVDNRRKLVGPMKKPVKKKVAKKPVKKAAKKKPAKKRARK